MTLRLTSLRTSPTTANSNNSRGVAVRLRRISRRPGSGTSCHSDTHRSGSRIIATWPICSAAARGRSDAAAAALRDGLTALPAQVDLLYELADLSIEVNRKDEAADAVDRLAKAGFPQGALDCLNARLAMNEELWLEASRLLERAEPLL